MERVIKARKHRPVFMVDLAVPRDVEAEVAELTTGFFTPSTTWPKSSMKAANCAARR
jgi:hypothetical protein